MFDTLKAGDQVRCTVVSEPRAQDKSDTIARLMRRDPIALRALRRAQRMRRQRMVTYIRGHRVWFKREHPAQVIRVVNGESWTMVFTPDILPDLKSIATYIKVEKAK